jgi:hypothetical protein
VSGHTRTVVAALALLGILAWVAVIAFAANACPTETPTQPCPQAGLNRAGVIALAALATGLLVTPFGFIAEFAGRRRILYRGIWSRAIRRGVLAAAVVGALAGLRLAGALSVPAALLLVVMAGMVEWYAVRRSDRT